MLEAEAIDVRHIQQSVNVAFARMRQITSAASPAGNVIVLRRCVAILPRFSPVAISDCRSLLVDDG